MKPEDEPLTRKQGLEILELLKAINTDIRRLNKALFGEDNPKKDEGGRLDQFSEFGHRFGQNRVATEKHIATLEAEIRGGVTDGD